MHCKKYQEKGLQRGGAFCIVSPALCYGGMHGMLYGFISCNWSTAMDIDAFDVSEIIHSVWEFRQAALQLGESNGTKFLCPNCEQMKPFAGDNALGYYNETGGVVLVCNECLLEFQVRRGVERVKQM
jgi:hypothetical protein